MKPKKRKPDSLKARARPLEKRGFAGNKKKFYEKARAWFKADGSAKLKGFKRAGIFTDGKRIKIILNARVFEGSWLGKQVGMGSTQMKPVFAFVSKNMDRVILIGKSELKTVNGLKGFVFEAFSAVPTAEGKISFWNQRGFARAFARYSEKEKIVVESELGWPKARDTAPEWIKESGFGLFVESLRQTEIAKRGVKKWFAYIKGKSESRDFAELRGFRSLTKEEARQLERFNHKGLVEINYLVKDIMPVRKKT